MQPLVVQASRSSRAMMLAPYLTFALCIVIVGGRLAGWPGATAGIVVALVALRIGSTRNRRTLLTLSDDRLSFSNGAQVHELPWTDVQRIEAKWKYFGMGAPRGQMLYAVSRPEAPWSPVFLYASFSLRRRVRQEVYEALARLSERRGFDLGTSLGPGPNWTTKI